ncbi:sensor domain-containing diguanylate cyclase [Vibrio sp. 99K-1]|uniref:sensor domain-containing diguanylate cyclase n=1 Tax=Vibrio sp. 99K-1 TaxID=2607603 RepID=UPI001493973A|nr:sensor domain-containing diguanylate cyclase [Vibrio sp. 99K-1]NOI86613.1 GGDEF domain-containing protein [Vibrio sp. 99K-1]
MLFDKFSPEGMENNIDVDTWISILDNICDIMDASNAGIITVSDFTCLGFESVLCSSTKLCELHKSRISCFCEYVYKENRTVYLSGCACGESNSERETDNYKSFFGIPVSGIDGEVFAILFVFDLSSTQYTESQVSLIENISTLLRSEILLKEESRILYKNSHFDIMTMLLNRRGFFHEFNKANIDDGEIVCLYFDLDNLKYINDTYGHFKGDDYISGFASCIRNHIKYNTIPARVGGDEFIVVIHSEDPGYACELVRKIRTDFHEFIEGFRGDDDVPLGFSYGCGTSDSQSLNIINLIKSSDENMYRNKKNKL